MSKIRGRAQDHPFWSVTDQRFEPAADLAPGELVRTASGHTRTVDAALHLNPTRAGPACNLEVSEYHTYHVGHDHLWVHKACIVPNPYGRRGS